MDGWKSRGGQSQRREEKKREDQRRERARRKKMQVCQKDRKVANRCGFPMICGSGGSKSRLAKAAGAEPPVQLKNSKLHAAVVRSTRPRQNVPNTCRTTFGSWAVENVHAGVARSTFRSQKSVEKRQADHIWKLRCWKSVRSCGARHVSKSKCIKQNTFRALLEVEMFQSACRCGAKHISKWKYTRHSAPEHFWKLSCWKCARRCGAKRISKSEC